MDALLAAAAADAAVLFVYVSYSINNQSMIGQRNKKLAIPNGSRGVSSGSVDLRSDERISTLYSCQSRLDLHVGPTLWLLFEIAVGKVSVFTEIVVATSPLPWQTC